MRLPTLGFRILLATVVALMTDGVSVHVQAFAPPMARPSSQVVLKHKAFNKMALDATKKDDSSNEMVVGAAALALALATAPLIAAPDSANAAMSGGRMGGDFPPPPPPAIVRPAPPQQQQRAYRQGYSRGYRSGYYSSPPRVTIAPSIGLGSPFYYGPYNLHPPMVMPYANPYGVSPFVPYGGYPFGRPGIGIGFRFLF